MPDDPVSAFGYPAVVIHLSGLPSPWRQSKIGADALGFCKPVRIIDGQNEIGRRHRADTGNAHEHAAGFTGISVIQHKLVQLVYFLLDRSQNIKLDLKRGGQLAIFIDNLPDAGLKTDAGDPLD